MHRESLNLPKLKFQKFDHKNPTTIYASADGVVNEILAQVGDTVESKDLLVRLKAK